MQNTVIFVNTVAKDFLSDFVNSSIDGAENLLEPSRVSFVYPLNAMLVNIYNAYLKRYC